MRRLGGRGFANYKPSYQKTLLKKIEKLYEQNYERLHTKLKTATTLEDSDFAQPKQDVLQKFKVYQVRIARGSLTTEQAKQLDETLRTIQTQGANVFDARVNEIVELERKMSGTKVANAMEQVLNQLTEEEKELFFQSKYYQPVRDVYDSLSLNEFLLDNLHSPQMERLLDFVEKYTNINLNKLEQRSYNRNIENKINKLTKKR